MKFGDVMPVLTELLKLSDKINKPYFGCWKHDKELLVASGAEAAFRNMDLRLADLKDLTDKIEQFSATNGLLCRITYTYWLCQIVGNRELVDKYGLVLETKANEWFVPEVTVRILLEGTPIIIKVLPDKDGGLIYCWGGGHDWEVSLPEIMKKMEEEIKKIKPLA